MLNIVIYGVALVAVAASTFYLYLRNVLTFWKKRNVPTLNPSVFLGDFGEVLTARKSIGQRYRELYEAFGDEPFGGVYIFDKPMLLVKNLEILKQVFVKDFQNFHSRGFYYDAKKNPMSGHLFALDGPAWRRMRVKLTPTFTTGKIKMMFDTLAECSSQLDIFLAGAIKKDDVVDIREVIARFSTDVIASVAFGIQCNSIHNPDAEFRVIGRKVFDPTLMLSFRNLTYFFKHSVARLFNLSPADPSVERFMTKVVYDTVSYREANNISRPDFLNLLIALKNQVPDCGDVQNGKEPEKDNRPITMGEILAQVFVFFIAGFETTSTTTGFTLYELAKNPEIQRRVQKEFDEALKRSNGKVTYELLRQMLPYTDQVVNETMRMYPAVPLLTREAAQDVEFSRGPGESPLKVEKGQGVAIPVLGLHMDPKYYPNPKRFDPDRFSPENVANRPGYVYLPFGDGPRLCIGMRLALIQVKLALVTILRNYTVEMCSRTLNPMKMDPKSFVPFPEGGLWLRLRPRDDLVSAPA